LGRWRRLVQKEGGGRETPAIRETKTEKNKNQRIRLGAMGEYAKPFKEGLWGEAESSLYCHLKDC